MRGEALKTNKLSYCKEKDKKPPTRIIDLIQSVYVMSCKHKCFDFNKVYKTVIFQITNLGGGGGGGGNFFVFHYSLHHKIYVLSYFQK